jgi:hypothetical protein
MPRRKPAPKPPRCPDPERYTLIVTKEGTAYWRLKRGLGKPAVLNQALQEQAYLMSLTVPAARRILNRLAEYLDGIYIGRSMVRIGSLLTRDLKNYERINYSSLKDFDFHKDPPVRKMLREEYEVHTKDDTLTFSIKIPVDGAVVKPMRWSDGYQFQLIMLEGDPLAEAPLGVHAVASEVFSLNVSSKKGSSYSLDLKLPKGPRPWVVFLKVTIMHEGVPGHGPRSIGMTVIATGAGGKALV